MIKFPAKLGDGFRVVIAYSLSSDGDLDQIEVTSAATGQVLDDLIYGSSLLTEAEKKAEEHMARQLLPTQTLRHRRLDVAAQCYDTPYAMGAV